MRLHLSKDEGQWGESGLSRGQGPVTFLVLSGVNVPTHVASKLLLSPGTKVSADLATKL